MIEIQTLTVFVRAHCPSCFVQAGNELSPGVVMPSGDQYSNPRVSRTIPNSQETLDYF
ncbi:Protein of unknown function [Pyronema omphalodes CBS 100304]|uniref:Uncharacterized protein n=1 Tax=Pyronema omphalodes (strain CBS 100304) TaxID=1076935 RepID=U4LF93_PYROM|nr:Protein of unknown function [Pyronema omphalodes CBS 100304]